MSDQITIASFDADQLESHLEAFGEMLHACVHDGASIGFIDPFDIEDAEAFWRDMVLPAMRGGRRDLFVALLGGKVVGCPIRSIVARSAS
jgi:hypothetical protein